MGDIEEDYTEERLADYDRVAIDHDDVLVMGFVTLVRQLRAEIAAERAWRKRATIEEVIAALTVKLTECTGALIEQSSKLGVVMAERDGLRLDLAAERARTDALVRATDALLRFHGGDYAIQCEPVEEAIGAIQKARACVTPSPKERKPK